MIQFFSSMIETDQSPSMISSLKENDELRCPLRFRYFSRTEKLKEKLKIKKKHHFFSGIAKA